MKLKLISEEAVNITLDEVKAHLRVTDDSEDTLILQMIKAAVKEAENITNRALSVKTYEFYLDVVKSFILPKPPFIELSSLQIKQDIDYVDFNSYKLDDIKEPAEVIIENSFNCNEINCLKCTYKTGYSEVPEDIKIWIFMQVANLYEYRTQFETGISVNAIKNPFVDNLLTSYKVRSFG